MIQSSIRRRPRDSRGLRQLAGWVVFILALAVWFMMMAPSAIGGPATYVLVQGQSMEPMLHTGDLAIARQASSYEVGELIVFPVKNSDGSIALVIHRIISGDAASGWTTQGDNNAAPDPWTLPDSQILGRYALGIGAFGTALDWAGNHPLGFAGACTAVAVLFYLPWRRRRIAPELAGALARATREPRREGRTTAELVVLGLSGVACLVSIALLGFLGSAHRLSGAPGLIGLMALLWTGGFVAFMVTRLFDGRGVPEPASSLYALSGRLYQVDQLPPLATAAAAESAIDLRTIAEKYRLPVLHHVDPESGDHEFVLITEQAGSYVWSPRGARAE